MIQLAEDKEAKKRRRTRLWVREYKNAMRNILSMRRDVEDQREVSREDPVLDEA